MRIRWTIPALRQLGGHIGYIAEDNPDAAERVRDAVISSVEYLADNPHRGRPGRRTGTRELVIAKFPTYIVIYRVTDAEIRIIAVWHGRQSRKR